jgi:squalene-associated FAD-dependent desaturase
MGAVAVLTPDLVVVGGGWAGSSAAWRASRRGLRVELLESAPRLGGRASSFADGGGGLLDNGQHLFLGAYKETLGLLKDLGTAPWVEFGTPLSIPFLMADGRVETLRASRLPGPLGLGLGLLRFAALGPRERVDLLRLTLSGGAWLAAACLGQYPARSGDLSVADWLASTGQSRRMIALVWEPMVLAALNAAPGRARLKEFLAVLGQGFLRGGRSAALGRARAPLGALLAPLPKLMEAQGSRVRLNAAVGTAEAIPAGWRLRLGKGELLESPRLILALPARAAARLLGEGQSARLGLAPELARPASAILSVWLWSARPVLPRPMLAFGPQGEEQARFHWGFSEAVDGGWRSCVVSSAAGAWAREDSSAILAGLAAFLAARGLPYTWERARVVREPRATPVFAPGSPARLAQATGLRGLALAGDWTETGLPATIEGAVRSGRLAFESLTF